MLSPEDTPPWFDPSLFDDAERREVSVAGAGIRYVSAGEASLPTLLFVHGARAHARWWEAALSLLVPRGIRWLAMDLSGHGDSDWRESYSVQRWADEVRAVAQAEAGRTGITIIGHSLGGVVSLAAAAHGAAEIASVVSVDAVPRSKPASAAPSGRPTWFASHEQGAAEFASRDARSSWPRWLALRVGEQSLRASDGGWAWNHDVKTRGMAHPPDSEFDGLDPSRVALITAGDSFMASAIDASAFLHLMGERMRRVNIPGAGHDVMMERPAEFIEALLPLLSPTRPA